MKQRGPKTIAEKLQSLMLSVLFSGLMVMAGVTMIGDFLLYRAALTQNLTAVARVVGASGASAVAKGDPDMAATVLLALSVENDLSTAALKTKDGRVLAQYSSEQDSAPSGTESGAATALPIGGDVQERVTFYLHYIELVAPIMSNGTMIGTISIRSSLARFYAKLFWRLLVTLVELSIALAAALLFASRLQKRIAQPISNLANAMGEVWKTSRFDVRVVKQEDDEVGVLIDGFNTMLTHIRDRDARLEDYRHQIEQQNAELMTRATRDPLTGCLNRRAFFEEVTPLFGPDRADPLACIMIDIDKFKSVNDRYGHQVGDEVIQVVAKMLAQQLRPQDLLCRYGGEEFCAILSVPSLDIAVRVAERLRVAIESQAGPSLRRIEPITVTASFGVAALVTERLKPAELIDRADQALYHAKRNGRNRVCRYPQELAMSLAAATKRADGTDG